MRRRLFWLATSLGLAILPSAVRAAVIYVNPAAAGPRTGAGWANGFATVADGMAAATTGDEIWVRGGTYVQTATLILKNGVGLYGGFAGTETARAQRNPALNLTALDGNQKGAVVFANEAIGPQTVVNGFTIRNGNGVLALDKDNRPFTAGGGVAIYQGSPEISGNIITANTVHGPLGRGAAVYVKGANQARIVNNVIIANGSPTVGDGAVYVEAETLNCSPLIANNVITANRGHAVKSENATPTIANNVIHNNVGDGVFLFNNKALPNLTTVVVSGNTIVENRPADEATAYEGFGVSALFNGTLALSNNIIAWNRGGGIAHQYGFVIQSSHNCVYGNNYSNFTSNLSGTPNPLIGNGNLVVNPGLASMPYDDFHIRHDSPCRNAGDPAAIVDGTDMDGQPRVQGGAVDIGADESDGTAFPLTYNVVRVKPAGSDAGAGFSWTAAKRTIQAAVDLAGLGGEVWVAAGSYAEAVSAPQSLLTYGGFAGAETAREQRNWTANPTIIDAGKAGSAYAIRGGSTAIAAFSGFTVRNSGSGLLTGGISIARTPLGTISLDHNIIRNNNYGIAAVGAAPQIADNTVIENTSDAIYLNSSGEAAATPVILNNFVHRNGGSGVYVYSGGVEVRNNQITRNGTQSYDAGINLGLGVTGSAKLVNNTVAANAGFGVFMGSGSQLQMANNIVAWNGGNGVWLFAPSLPATLLNNCVYGNIGRNFTSFPADPTGTNGNISVDPMFATVPYNDFHIRPNSPCRDAGDAASAAGDHDIDGQPRVQGAKVDIGADESNGTVYDPLLTIVRVRPDGNDADDGSSWSKAKRTVQAAIDAAVGGEVWVAAGTYQHTGGAQYSDFITLRPNVPVYAGFLGVETAREQRDYMANETILHGGLTGDTVVIAGAATAPTVLDGFVVTGSADFGTGVDIQANDFPVVYVLNNLITGNHNGLSSLGASPIVVGNLISFNTGRGMGIQAGTEFQAYNNTIFHNDGGGASLTDTSGRFAGNLIADNALGNDLGIGLTVGLSGPAQAPRIESNTIVRSGGLAIDTTGPGQPAYVNNIIAWNGRGVRVDNQAPTLRNNCLYGNGTANVTGFADPIGANGNISADPRFASAAFADYHIRPDSPCRDAGDNAAVSAGDVDIDGQARLLGAKVDIGADESDGAAYPNGYNAIRVSPTGSDANDGSSWAKAKRTVGAALTGGPGIEAWVAAGTYSNPTTEEYEPFLQLGVHQSVYGGFAGTETAREQRDPRKHETILDGAGYGSAVVLFDGQGTAPTVLDGFTIRHPSDYAGGVNVDGGTLAVVRNNVIRDANTGVSVTNGTAAILNNLIVNNQRGISSSISTLEIRNNVVANNSEEGIRLTGTGSPVVANNTIVGNTPPDYSAAVAADGETRPTLLNNIIAFNTGGLYGNGATIVLRNNDIYGNNGADFRYYDDPTGQSGNISADPRLANLAAGDYHLLAGSPCIDKGDNTAVKPGDLDLDGQARQAGAAVDIGADEFGSTPPVSIADALRALSADGGLSRLGADERARLNVADTGASQGRVDLLDAVKLLKTALAG
ncbi:MAG TPA: right-handed parallel beta-helix repeat-containing protein [Armatimonadota bacterium]